MGLNLIRFPPGLQPFRPCTGLSTLLDLRSATIVSRAFSCRSPRDWLGLQARERPDAPALTWRGQTLDYASLARAARQWAGALEAAGLGPGQVLGLSTTDPWLTVAALYGSLQAGVVLLPLDPALAPQRRALLLSQAGCTRLLSDRAVPPPIRHLSPDVLLCPGGPPPSRAAGTGAGCGIINATSGTSGEPKGVMLTMANIAAAVGAARRRIPLGPGDCWLDPLPLFHIGGLSVFFRALEA
ncbi:MAG TPA: long-chain fatty acid--CoA ligase, partial [Sedimenticola sp.]|nr:long-chain fatty acid--CoA ligase [Sedimenticola sp.]